ncbi:ClpP/crotonase [Auriculariales sp. MPI-PUGE-AT-0066]|nr:ClpP/crotonase [Auriculariales sp. MPI-PUGE-AT-0066]
MASTTPSYAGQYKLLQLTFASPGVLHLELNRTPVNAFNPEFWREYGNALDRISVDADVRVVVVSSALPKLFSAGIDLYALMTMPGADAGDTARRAILIRQFVLDFQHSISAAERCPYPVIAAVHGQVIGLGLDIIAACDVRLASEDSSFCVKETAVGFPADIGTLARVPKLTGNASLLHELALTARPFGSSEALSLGLISRSVPGSRSDVVKVALEVAAEIAQHSPLATLGTKRFLANARERTVPEALEYQATWNMAAVQAPDLEQTARAIMKKEKVQYKPLATWTQSSLETKSKL